MKVAVLLLISGALLSPNAFAGEAAGPAYGSLRERESISEAMPGGPLYRRKRRQEAESLRAESDPLKRSELHARHAEERLAEAESMFAAGEHRTAGNLLREYERSLNLAMSGIDRAAARGLDVSRPLEEIERAAGRNTEVLTRLLEEVPEQAGPGIRRAIEVSSRGRNRARDMREKLERGGMPPGRREGVRPEAPDRRGPPAGRPPPVRPEEVETPEEREPSDTPDSPERPERPRAPGEPRGPGDIRGPGASGRP